MGHKEMNTGAVVLLVSAAAVAISDAVPCEVPSATGCVLGGDDAETGAAWAAVKLNISTLLVLTHPRDLGGDTTSFYNDSIGMLQHRRDMPYRHMSAGGFNHIIEASGATVLGPGAACDTSAQC